MEGTSGGVSGGTSKAEAKPKGGLFGDDDDDDDLFSSKAKVGRGEEDEEGQEGVGLYGEG